MMTGEELLERVRPVEHRLSNGLTLLVRADSAAPVVAIVTYVKAGYFHEPDSLVGISHVLEHMYFKGTSRRGVGEIARATKAAGGYLNAGTIYDHTSYYSVLPSAAVAMGLDIQADALIHSTLDEEELRKELLVIIEEVKRKHDNPSAMATEKLYEAIFDVHPMRRWRMGQPDQLRALTRDDVLGYYRQMYRGPNVILVVAGDVDVDRIIDTVETLYAAVPGGAVELPEPVEPDRGGARIREMQGDIGHSYGEVGWRTPGPLHADTPALDALAVALGQGRASRLYRGVRQRGLVSSIDAYNYTPAGVGVFGVSLECEPGHAAGALRGSWREVERVAAEPVADHEAERVSTLLQARLLRRIETVEGQANLLAQWQALGDWRQAASYLDRMRAIQPDQLSDVARRYLDRDRVTTLLYRPDGAAPLGWSDGDVAAALDARPPEAEPDGASAVSAAGAVAGASPSVARVEPGPSADAASAPSASRGVSAAAVDGVFVHPLDGGRLVVKRRPGSGLVSMSIARRGGVLNEGPERAGITGLVMRASVKGTASRSADRIAVETERLGGSIGAAAGADLLSWSLTVPAEHFETGLELLADVAVRPAFPPEEVERERQVMLADLERLRDDMYRYPLRLLLRAAFGDHPYGHGPAEMEPALSAMTAAELERWHATELDPPWVLVVGDVEPDRVVRAVGDGLGATSRAAGADDAAPTWPASPRVEEVKRDRAQTAMALGFPGPPRNHPDRPALEVLSAAVSGLGNRLFEELRSRRSLAYTVHAFPLVRRYAGSFVGYIATSADRAGAARDGLLQEMARLRDQPPSEEEMERARRYSIGAWQIRSQTNGAQLSDLATAMMLGEGLVEIREHEDRIRAVDRDAVLAAAHRWLDPDRLVEGVVRGGGNGAGDDV